jgi:hypothetical protein
VVSTPPSFSHPVQEIKGQEIKGQEIKEIKGQHTYCSSFGG